MLHRSIAILSTALITMVSVNAYAKEDIPKLKIRATNSYLESQPAGKAMDFFAKRVSELSDGRMTVQVYHAGKLYTEDASIQAVLDGTVDMGMASAANHGPFTKAWAPVETPFLLNRQQFRDIIIQGEIGQELRKQAQADGLHALLVLETGGHRVVGGSRPVKVPADMEGKKIRTAQSSVMLGFYRSVGANPVVVPWGETYLALSNHVVDGLDAVTSSWPLGNLAEVAKYITAINWAPVSTVVDTSVAWWKKRTPKQQEIITQAALEAQAFSMKLEDADQAAVRETIKKQGATIYDPTPEELEKWRAASKKVWATIPGDQSIIEKISTITSSSK